MYLAGFIFVLGCTLAMCVVVALIKLIIAEVGITFFTIFLVIISALYLLVMNDKGNDE